MNARLDEQELWTRLLQTPEKTWVEFWEYVLPVLRSKVGSFNLSREDSEDILSEIAFRLSKNDFRIVRNWDPNRCPLRGYIGVVAKSAALDFLQSSYFRYNREKATPPTASEGETLDLLDTLETENLSPADRLDFLQLEETVRRTIDCWAREGGLKPEEEVILRLRMRAVPFQEIADILGITADNAMTKFHRIKENFRKRLEKAGVVPSG